MDVFEPGPGDQLHDLNPSGPRPAGLLWTVPIRASNVDIDLGGGFSGAFIRNPARMEWSAAVGNFQFVSAPLESSSSSFAEVGLERNGLFFRSMA